MSMLRITDATQQFTPQDLEDTELLVITNITEAISGLINKSGFVNLDIEDLRRFFKNAGAVYFGQGIAKDCTDAAKKLLKCEVRFAVKRRPDNKACKKCGHIMDRRAEYCTSCGYIFPVSERY